MICVVCNNQFEKEGAVIGSITGNAIILFSVCDLCGTLIESDEEEGINDDYGREVRRIFERDK